MKSLFAACLAVALATPLCAADLMERYEAMGEMSASIGETQYEMVITYDREKQRGYADRKMIMGSFLTINSMGRVVDENGKPGAPLLQVTLQEQSGKMKLLSAELFDEQGFDAPLSMGADGGKGTVSSYTLEGDVMTATVEGTFLRLSNYTKMPEVAEGAEPLPTTISWTVTLPPME